MLLEKIKQDSIEARKQKSTIATFLVTLYAEAAKVGKDKRNGLSTDEEVIAVLKKFKAGAETIIAAAEKQQVHNATDLITQANIEMGIVDQYLPQMMSNEEVEKKIIEYINTLTDKSPKQMGNVMNYLKQNFGGLYDGGVASKIVKQQLQG
jgi:uncharacterized protein YqeY